DRTGHACAAAPFHQMKEIRVLAPLGERAGTGLHRTSTGVGLDAPAPPARAAPPAELDHRVTDLARGAPPEPGLAAEDQPTADAGAPEDAQNRVVWLARAELELGISGDLHVVAHPHRGAEVGAESLRER